jgi:hypothetical protein
MFRTGWIVFRIVSTLILIGILIGGGVMIYNAGQAQGYAMGLAAASQDGVAPAPYSGIAPFYGYAPFYGPGWGHAFFFPFGPIFGFLAVGALFFLFFGALGAIFRRRSWGHGAWTGGQRQDHPWRHGPWAGQPQPTPQGEPGPATETNPGDPSK